MQDLAAPSEEELMQAMLKMMQQIWDNKGIPEGTINDTVTRSIFNNLWKGVTSNYGVDVSGVDFDTPDFAMLEKLKANVWHFSAAKNYQQLRELSGALLDENGLLRSFRDFESVAKGILNITGKTYLRAEYELAVAGSQMAGKWVRIEETADVLPYLVFDAVLDSQTTAQCYVLNGTKLPYTHPFWDRNYPPNHFNCRSTARQEAYGPATAADKIPTSDIPKIFQTNLAKSGFIFPADHPYFIDNPQGVKEAADRLNKVTGL